MPRIFDNWGQGDRKGRPYHTRDTFAHLTWRIVSYMVGATLAVALARFAITFTVALVWSEE